MLWTNKKALESGRGCVDQIFTVKQVTEKVIEKESDVYGVYEL